MKAKMNIWKYFFLLLLIPSSTLQATWIVTKAKFGIYTIQKNNDLEGTFSLMDPEGKELTTLRNVNLEKSNLLKFCKDEIFWKESPPPKNNKPSLQELWVFKLKLSIKEKVLESDEFMFEISSGCSKIAVEKNSALEIFDRHNKQSSQIARTGDGGRSDGFSIFGWSDDEKRFWFSSGAVGTFSKIAVYENGKTTWFPRDHAIDDYSLELNEGLLAYSNRPFNYDESSEEIYLSKAETTILKVLDVRTDREIEINKGISNNFEPRWDAENLQYSLNTTAHKISKTEIKEKLNKVKK